MRIQHNITAMNSYRNFNTNSSRLSKNLEKLSSGYKINRAGDDAAGLAISEKMRAQITGLEGATKNAKDGISLIQTAEGALTEVHDMLNRMTTLAEQSANGTYQNELDREQLQKEVEALKSEIDRVADSTNFNGLKLLDGSLSDKFESVTTKPSALSEITSEAYGAKGASPAISTSFRIDRPAAETKQTRASFEVDLTDVDFNAVENNTITLSVQGTNITATVPLAGITTAEAAVTALVGGGHALTSTTEGKLVANDNATAANDNTAAKIKDDADWKNSNKSGAYVEIENHIYKMEAANGGKGIKFTQVDFMDTKGEQVDPNFNVTVTGAKGTGASDPTVATQTPNWQVEKPVTGKAVGSSQQAEVSMSIDFSKLKDGDRITVANKTYTLQIGAGSTASGTNNIDLKSIFKNESDLADETKQKDAMVAIASAMKATAETDPWSVGNGGVADGVGKLSFMSQGGYADGTVTTDVTGDKAIMDGEDEVMKQFFSERDESGATTSFNLDVTQIKAGDTFTIDGQTFEFTDGDEASTKNAVAINLHDEGIAQGVQNSKLNAVTTKIKNAIEDTYGVLKDSKNDAKYSVTTDGNKVTLTSKDDTSTTANFENREAAKIDLPTETKHGEGLVLQIGDTADSYNKLTVSIEDMHSKALGIGDLDVSTQEGAAAALDKIKAAINAVSDTRGNMGALQNRLDHTINNLGVMRENIQSAESMIRDTDVAEEMMTYTKNNILNQSAQAMLAQANQLPQGVLQLLG